MVGPAGKRRASLAPTGRVGPIVGAAGQLHRRRRSQDDPLSIPSACGELVNCGRGCVIWPTSASAGVGYRRLFVLLRQEGERSGKNRIYRLYREEGLTVRKRRARRRAVGTRAPIPVEAVANARWSLDFVHDQFANGRRFRVLNVVDDVTRECLAAIPDTSISGPAGGARAGRFDRASWKTRHLIVSDNPGTEFTSRAVLAWAQEAPDRLAFHRAGEADAERLLRELQRSHARRASQREPVLRPRRRPPAKITDWVSLITTSAVPIRRWAIKPQPPIAANLHATCDRHCATRPAPPTALRCSTRAQRRKTAPRL